MTTLQKVIPQISFLAPVLVVYLVGVVLSLVSLKRHPKPAALALVGCCVLFLVSLIFPFVQGYLFASWDERGWDVDNLDWWLSILGIIRTLLFAAAFSLVLAAVFVGRSSPATLAGVADSVGPEHALDAVPQPHRATLVLVLGILSLVACAPLGIAAWVMASNDLSAMRAGSMDRTGETITSAGRVLGIIGTVLFGLGLIGALLWFAAMGAAL